MIRINFDTSARVAGYYMPRWFEKLISEKIAVFAREYKVSYNNAFQYFFQ